MIRIYFLPAAMLGLTLAAPAFADEGMSSETQSKTTVERDTSGNVHKKQTRSAKSTDSEGTTTSLEKKVEVDTDTNGNGEKKVTTETSTDPKGLMNKSKTVTTDSVEYKDGKVEKKYQRKENGKTVEETSEKSAN